MFKCNTNLSLLLNVDIMNTIQSPGEVVVTPSCTTTNQIKGKRPFGGVNIA